VVDILSKFIVMQFLGARLKRQESTFLTGVLLITISENIVMAKKSLQES
jgi:hypothetical protein